MSHRSVVLCVLLSLFGAVFGPGQAAAQTAPASLDFLDEYGRVTDHYVSRDVVRLRVTAAERNDPLQKDSFLVHLTAGGDSEDMQVQETGFNTGVFVGEIWTHPYYGTSPSDGTLTTDTGTQIQASYFPLSVPNPVVATATVRRGTALFVDAQGRPAEVYLEGSRAYVRVKDRSLAYDDIRIDHAQVQVSAAISGDVETVALTETGEDTGVLEGSIGLRLDFAQPGDGVLQTRETVGSPVNFDTLTVSYNNVAGPVTASIGLTGSRIWFIDAFGNLADRYAAGSAVHIRVEDQNSNRPGLFDQAQVRVVNLQNGDEEIFSIWETTKDSGIFEGSLPIVDSSTSSTWDDRLQAVAGDAIEVRHPHGMVGGESTDQAQIDFHSVSFIDDEGRATDALLESGIARVRVFSRGDNLNAGSADQLTVTVQSLYGGGDQEQVQLTETGPDTSVFEGGIRLTFSAYTPGDGKLMTANSGPPEYRPDQVTATYGFASAVAHTIGARVYFLDAYGRVTDHYVRREPVRVRVIDQNRNNPQQKDSFLVHLNAGGDSEDMMVQETGFDTGVFEGSMGTHEYYGSSSNDGTLTTNAGTQIQAAHYPMYFPDAVVALATVRSGVLLFVDAQGRPAETYLEGSRAYVRVMDRSVAYDDIRIDTLQVQISAGISGDAETLTLTETGVETGVLEGSIQLRTDFAQPGNGRLETRESFGTPHEFDTLTASYSRPTGTVSGSITLSGSRTFFVDAFGNPTESYASGSRAYVRVEDQNANRAGLFDQVIVVLRGLTWGDEEVFYLQETGKDSGIFEGSMALDDSAPPSVGDGRLQVLPGELIDVIHNDAIGLTASGDRAQIATLSILFIDEAGRATDGLLESGTGRIRVFNRGDNTSGAADQISVTVQSLYGADQEEVQLTETGGNTNVFEGSFRMNTTSNSPGDNRLRTSNSGPPEYRPDQVTARYGSFSATARMVGARIYFLDAYGRVTDHYVPRVNVRVRVVDQNRNDPFQKDSFLVRLTSSGDSEDLTVQETGFDTGVFEGEMGTHPYYGSSINDGTLTTYAGGQIQATHFPQYLPDPVVAYAEVRTGELLFVDAQGRPADVYLEGSRAYVRVMDRSVAYDDIRIDTLQVQISAGISGDVETLTLTETGVDTGVMEGSIRLRLDFAQPGNGTLETRESTGTPHEFDTITASYTRPYGTVSASIGLTGSRTWFIDAFGNQAETYATDSRVYVRVEDQNANRPGLFDQSMVFLRGLSGGDEEMLYLQETTKDSGIFEGSMALDDSSPMSAGDGRLQTTMGETIEAVHNDGMGLTASGDQAQIENLSILFIDEAGRATGELLESGVGRIRVFSRTDNSSDAPNQISVTVRSRFGADQEQVQLTETGGDTSTFEGNFRLTVSTGGSGDNLLRTSNSGPPAYQADEVTASYGPYSAVAHTIGGRVYFLDAYGRVTDHYLPRQTVRVRVVDPNRNNPFQRDSFLVRLSTGDFEDLTVQETGADTGVFEGSIGTHEYYGSSINDGTLTTYPGTVIQATHYPMYLPEPIVAQAEVRGGEILFVDAQGRPAETYLEGSRAYVRVADRSVAYDDIRIDTLQVQISAGISGDVETLTLTETGVETGVLEGSIPLKTNFAQPGNGTLETRENPGPPHEFDTLTASYNRPGGPLSASIGLIGSQTWFIDAFGNPTETYAAGSKVYVRVEDQNANRAGLFDQVMVGLRALAGGDEELLYLQETTRDSGIFEGSLDLAIGLASPGDNRLQATAGEMIEAIHNDLGVGLTASGDRARIDFLSVIFIDEAGQLTDELLESGTGRVRVFSRNDNANDLTVDQLWVTLRSLYSADQEQVQLTETGPGTSVFEGSFRLATGFGSQGNNKLETGNSGPPEYKADQVTASYGPFSAEAHTIGARLFFLDSFGRVTDHYVPRENVRVRVVDYNRNSPVQIDSFLVRLNSSGDLEDVTVRETGYDTGIFEGQIGTHEYYGTSSFDGTLTTYAGWQISASHHPAYLPEEIVTWATINSGALLFVDAAGQPAEVYLEGSRAYVRVMDRTLAYDDYRTDSMLVQLTAAISGDVEYLNLIETGPSTGVMEGSIALKTNFAQPGNNVLETRESNGPPHEFDTITASYDRYVGGPVSASIGLTGSRTWFIDAFGQLTDSYARGSTAYFRVEDQNYNQPGNQDFVYVTVRNLVQGDQEQVQVHEVGTDSGIFEGSIALADDFPLSPGDGRLQATVGEEIEVVHDDGFGPTTSSDRATIGQISIAFVDETGRPAAELLEAGEGRVQVFSRSDNVDPLNADQMSVMVSSLYGFDNEMIQLTETGPDTSVFEGVFDLAAGFGNPGNNRLETSNSGPPEYRPDRVTASHGPATATATLISARLAFINQRGQKVTSYALGSRIRVRIEEPARGYPESVDTLNANVTSAGFDTESIELTETGPATGIYEGEILSMESFSNPWDGMLWAFPQAPLELEHFPYTSPQPLKATAVFSGNRAPGVSHDYAETIAGQAVTIPVLANDFDQESTVLTLGAVKQGANGTVAMNPDGSVTYTPQATFVGSDSFSYVVVDEQDGEAVGFVTVVVSPSNSAPVVNDATFSVEENTPIDRVVGTVLAADLDEGQSLTYAITGGNTSGVFSLNSTSGQIYVAGALDFEGTATYTFTVTVTDNGTPALSDTATITINVTDVNEAPVANDATYSAAESSANGTVVGTVTATDADTGQALSYAITAGNTGGAFAINASTGVITVSNGAAVDFETTPTFTLTVTVTDNGTPALSDTATVTINVTNANEAPVANDATFSAAENSANGMAVGTATATDADTGQTLSYAITAGNTGSAFAINASTGVITVANSAAVDFETTPTFTLTVTVTDDGTPALSDTATVTINVTNANEAPDAVNDTTTVAEDGSVAVAVLANDSDPDNDTLTVSAVTQGTNGSVVINPDKTVTYTPAANFNGSDSFTYTVSDGNGGTDTATVTVTVTSGNDAPDAVNDTTTVAEDGSVAVAVLANDSDPDNDTLTISAVTQGAQGTVVINPDKTITYTPAANYNGPDSFTYTVSDGNGGTDTATVSVTVTSGNDAPDAVNDATTVAEDGSVAVAVLANDSDPDGDTLAVTSVTQGTNGAVVINPDKTVTYTPAANFNGSDSFTYTISDGNGGTDTALVTVTVTTGNDAPVAVSDSATVAEDNSVSIAVLANDSDPDGDTLTVASVTQGTHGAVVINPDKTVTYTPNANFNGSDSFTYTVSDGNGGTETATVTVVVTAVNDAPVAIGDSAGVAEDGSVAVAVLANDSDVDGDTLNVTSVTQGAHGSTVINPDKTVTYTPAVNYNGPDSFTYTISDGNGGTASATVTVDVGSGNDAPVATSDSATVAEDSSVSIAVLANDSDPDGDTLTVASVTQGTHGAVVINPDKTVTYTPNANFNGSDSFTYTVSDGNGGTETATVTVVVTAVNDAPVAIGDSAGVAEDGSVAVPVLANDSDLDGDTLNVTSVTQGAHGSVVINPDKTVTYAPAANYNGPDSFTYTISDGNGGTASATVTVDVGSGNDAPVASGDSATTAEDNAVNVVVLANDSDADGDTLNVTAVTQGTRGTVTINPDKTVRYTPNANTNGTDSFTYTVSDGNGGIATAGVTVIVTPVNDAPVAVNDSATTMARTPLIVSVLTNDSDLDGPSLSVASVTQPANGSAAINANGTVTYTPAPFFVGTDGFTYTVSDGAGGSATANVTVTVLRPNRVAGNLQVLYNFDEGSGTTVNDVSGVGTPLNMTIGTPSAVSWVPGALSVNNTTIIGTAGTATKVINAAKASNEITVEAWVLPANLTQTGPARIVTLSQRDNKRNVTLGQSGNRIENRLRTSTTSASGNSQLTPVNSLTTNLVHVVFTRNSAGTAVTYMDGAAVATSTFSGNFSTWDSFQLGVANELTGGGLWRGQLHLVAVYSRALTSDEVIQNLLAGPAGN